MTEPAPDFLALTGPTASGKTELSLALAERMRIEVISMDSRQVYEQMDVGTDKVDAAARAAVRHHGLDMVSPAERYSAGRFARDARAWIAEIKGRDSVPADAIEFGMLAKQFEWNVTYAGADGRLGTGDEFEVRNQLHIPVNRPVVLRLSAEDVIHSFFVPQFRVKQDALPGQTINVWFEATKEGEYEIACAELCGLGHYRMRGRVFVHSEADYQAWLATRN